MRIRDLIRFGVFVGLVILHFGVQWYGWKVHLGHVPDQFDVGGRLWEVLSFPIFVLVPRRIQHLHFFELLLANSVLWGAVITIVASALFRPKPRATKIEEVTLSQLAQIQGSAPPVRAAAEIDPDATPVADLSGWDGLASTPFPSPPVKAFSQGRYEVLSEIGRGGFSTVYRARDHKRGIDVAVKVIDISTLEPEELPFFLEAFRDEAAVAGRLDHPGIVPVFDHDADAQPPFIVMSLIRGGSLRDRIGGSAGGRRVEWPEVAKIASQVAKALEYAGRNGVKAHRDIKPANIFCADSGYKVGDFGIARRYRLGGSGTDLAILAGAGTPGYMAPEQVLASTTVDWRADLFSLSVVLYELLTGKKPFQGVRFEYDPSLDPAAARAVIAAAYQAPPPLHRLVPEVPANLVMAVEKSLQLDRIQRFASWGDFLSALRP